MPSKEEFDLKDRYNAQFGYPKNPKPIPYNFLGSFSNEPEQKGLEGKLPPDEVETITKSKYLKALEKKVFLDINFSSRPIATSVDILAYRRFAEADLSLQRDGKAIRYVVHGVGEFTSEEEARREVRKLGIDSPFYKVEITKQY